jgi:hypothetical protein
MGVAVSIEPVASLPVARRVTNRFHGVYGVVQRLYVTGYLYDRIESARAVSCRVSSSEEISCPPTSPFAENMQLDTFTAPSLFVL